MAVPHAQVVGNSFISQYYNVLHQSPQVVHRFYTNASCLTRAEAGPEGHADTVFAQTGIHEKVMSLDYVGLRAEIKTVDCQDSYSGSVLVMVTGSLSNRSNGRRDFVQTFFLAPQEKGYFVLNDIFRYLDEPQVSTMSYVVANGPPQEHSPTPESVPETAHLEVSEPAPVAADEQIDEGYEDIADAEEEGFPEETVQDSLPLDGDEALDVEDSQPDQPKKSYASILRVVKGATDSSQPAQQHVAKPPPAAVPAEKPTPPVSQAVAPESPVVAAPPAEIADEVAAAPDVQGDGRSIYIKNLPMTVTSNQLDEEFSKFGKVKPGTNVKKQNNFCYAFLEFEEANSARAAIQASTTFQVGGKAVIIEEKRPMSKGFRARGRGVRNEGSRGRGFYNRAAGGGPAPPAAPGGGGSGGNRNYEPSGRGGRSSRGGYNNVANQEGRTNSDEYHPRYDNQGGGHPNYNNNYSNTNTANSNSSSQHPNFNANSSSNNSQGYQNPRSSRRYVSRSSSNSNSNSSGGGGSNPSNASNFGRNSSSSGNTPAAAPAAVTA